MAQGAPTKGMVPFARVCRKGLPQGIVSSYHTTKSYPRTRCARATSEGVLFYTGISAGVMTLERCSVKSRSAKIQSTTPSESRKGRRADKLLIDENILNRKLV